MRVRVFYHDRCFDGASSAALFSRFYRERIRNDVQFVYSGLLHRAGALFDEKQFDGDENAIVDFKYSSSPKITWWFDHHESAFLTPADAAHFEQDQSNHKFYDPDFKSCTGFIATVAEQSFGFDPRPVADLVYWTDIIDGALYPDAKTAVEMKEPAMKLTMVIETAQDHGFISRLIPLLASKPLAEIIEEPFVAARLPPLLERHHRSVAILRDRIQSKDGTLFFDISDLDLEGYNKFIPYHLHPECTYSIGLSKSNFRVKVAVGSNPWAEREPTVNLAKVCERYGGGGHARVGAISFDVNQQDAARKAAQEIVQELRAAWRSDLAEPRAENLGPLS
ncbi:MAG TPA: hypothetical protein VLW84_09330 [Terriglobales bacterium]|nr:hypothetical protein [Terriglobales bacterium]